MRFAGFVAFLVCLGSLAEHRAEAQNEFGHSVHGPAFDSGLRAKPWRMQGIGQAHFEITTKVPEVQEWFDQGNALLHSFWYEEAERTFRWCLKLDPECAMAYWGLAVSGFNWSNGNLRGQKVRDRYFEFLKQAVLRKYTVSIRERMFIEAWDEAFGKDAQNYGDVLMKKLKEVVDAFPNDVEARAYYGLFSIGHLSASKNEETLKQVLAAAPNHPGAHHYRIHTWDFAEPKTGLESCRMYGQIAPGIGHAMHMPGHIFSKVGMWHEAALAMDGATRVELRYMNERMALPFETWNFTHNRTYLCYIQEQLGMANAAIQGARDLFAAPMDPDYDDFESYDTGIEALVRALVKFERWEEILRPGSIPWRADKTKDKSRALPEGLACVGLGRFDEARARFAILRGKDAGQGITNAEIRDPKSRDERLLGAALLVAEGHSEDGMKLLREQADEEKKRFATQTRAFGDPPSDPTNVCRFFADLLFRAGDFKGAIPYYSAVLNHLPHDGFSLAGLAVCYEKAGMHDSALRNAGLLNYVWSGADPGLRQFRELKSMGLDRARPIAQTPFPERKYRPENLDSIGPSNWQPYAAPKLEVKDASGKTVRLSDFRGNNVLLVFFLSDECPHCVRQLSSINEKIAEFRKEDGVVLAVSSQTPTQNKTSLLLGQIGIKLLSDKNHENARRFASYDDFEGIELHSTILIDEAGRVRWKRTGGDPFTNVDFLLKEMKRVNASEASAKAAPSRLAPLAAGRSP